MFLENLERWARGDALLKRGDLYRKLVPEFPFSHRRLLEGDRISIGGRSWQVMVGYGHAPEHASLHCEASNVLISGDMLLPRISTNISVMASNPLGDPLGLFLASIDGFRALPEDTLVLPSHGRPFRGLHARVDQLHAHHAERCEVLLAACRRENVEMRESALAVAQGELREPSTLQPEVRLDQQKQLQCDSCHDPHNNQYGKFLVQDNTASALCLQCHVQNQWSASAHATSPANWNGTGRDPWPYTSGTTVAANGCENCHTPHHASTNIPGQPLWNRAETTQTFFKTVQNKLHWAVTGKTAAELIVERADGRLAHFNLVRERLVLLVLARLKLLLLVLGDLVAPGLRLEFEGLRARARGHPRRSVQQQDMVAPDGIGRSPRNPHARGNRIETAGTPTRFLRRAVRTVEKKLRVLIDRDGGAVREIVVDEHAHDDGHRVPAARDQSAEKGLFRLLAVGVERLRIVFLGEFDDFCLGQTVAPRFAHLSRVEIFPIIFVRHA